MSEQEVVEVKKETVKPELNAIQSKWQEAQYLAQSDLLPAQFKGRPENVLIAGEIAEQLSSSRKNLSTFSVMQNLYVVKGKTALSSKFMIALANSSGVCDEPIQFEVDRSDAKNLSVRAFTKIRGREVDFVVDMAMARAEGWTSNPKYKTLPELMLRYRAASFLIRTSMPEVTMGLTDDEGTSEPIHEVEVKQESMVKVEDSLIQLLEE